MPGKVLFSPRGREGGRRVIKSPVELVTHVAEKLIGQAEIVVQGQESDSLQAHHDDLKGEEVRAEASQGCWGQGWGGAGRECSSWRGGAISRTGRPPPLVTAGVKKASRSSQRARPVTSNALDCLVILWKGHNGQGWLWAQGKGLLSQRTKSGRARSLRMAPGQASEQEMSPRAAAEGPAWLSGHQHLALESSPAEALFGLSGALHHSPAYPTGRLPSERLPWRETQGNSPMKDRPESFPSLPLAPSHFNVLARLKVTHSQEGERPRPPQKPLGGCHRGSALGMLCRRLWKSAGPHFLHLSVSGQAPPPPGHWEICSPFPPPP